MKETEAIVRNINPSVENKEKEDAQGKSMGPQGTPPPVQERKVKPKKISTKSIGGSLPKLDDLIQQVKEEDKQKIANTMTWNIETIEREWQNSKAKQESVSIHKIMDQVKLSIKGDCELYIVTPTKLAKESIRKEVSILSHIRECYPIKDLRIVVSDDIDQFPEYQREEPKKELSNVERLENMKKKNPLIDKFIDRFNLNLDK